MKTKFTKFISVLLAVITLCTCFVSTAISSSAVSGHQKYVSKTQFIEVYSGVEAIKLEWSEKDCWGYELQMKTSGDWTTLKKITDEKRTTYTVTKLDAGTDYQFRIRAYAHNGKKYIYSAWDSITATTKPEDIRLRNKAVTKKSATIYWNNVDCDCFQLQYSTSMFFTKSTTKTLFVDSNQKTVTKTLTGLKANTKYYVRVRPFCTYNSSDYECTNADGCRIYGDWASLNFKTSKR